MRIVVISDTHDEHGRLGTLEGDVLIHCGDFCDSSRNDTRALERLDEWFAEQRFEVILCVGGNHDFAAQDRLNKCEPVFRNARWLQDAAHVHRGVTFYGSPRIPLLEGWAFYTPSQELQPAWSRIPAATDVLITHTPPFGILDLNRSGTARCGCSHLKARVRTVKPRFHVFGHNHSGAGVQREGATTFVNASLFKRHGSAGRSEAILDLPD